MLNILYYCILTNPFSLSSFEVTRKPVEKISESASVDFFFSFFLHVSHHHFVFILLVFFAY